MVKMAHRQVDCFYSFETLEDVNYPAPGCGLRQFATRIAGVDGGRLMTFTVQKPLKLMIKYPG